MDLRVCPVNCENINEGAHIGAPLHVIMQWFKTMTTNAYIRGVNGEGWPAFNGRLWQRNYYEHIIRNEQEYQSIAQYICSNPLKWQEDTYHV
jgi:putative transposase